MEEWMDTCETVILLGMNATKKYDPFIGQFDLAVPIISEDGRKSRVMMVGQDVGSVLKLPSLSPASAFAGNFGGERDEDRLYTTSHEYLVSHPADILKDQAEVMFFIEDMVAIRWICLKRTRPRKDVFAINGKPVVWYEMHVRQECANGLSLYHQRYVPIDAEGASLIAKSTVGGVIVCDKKEATFATLAASIIEDNLRAGTMLARVKESTEIKFAVPLDDYKSVFIGRDAPMQNGRKKAIIHWVSSHLRKKQGDSLARVKKHVRGVDEIIIDGITISITPNDKA